MKLQRQDSTYDCQACDLCGEHSPQEILVSVRLNGPLVRCRSCGLYFVASRTGEDESAIDPDASIEMERLAVRARELDLVEPRVEESERPWREIAAEERLADLARFISAGELLEVGCSTGELLAAARGRFSAIGVEADSGSSNVSLARGLSCLNGTLAEAEFVSACFDVAALYHTVEHLSSPRQTLEELSRVLRPGGWLVLETPNIANFWFRILGSRWRQFIPDHRFFFTPETMTRLCHETGFDIRELRSVGKAMSYRLFVSRIGRYHRRLGRILARLSHELGLDDRTLRLNLGDVMRLYAIRK